MVNDRHRPSRISEPTATAAPPRGPQSLSRSASSRDSSSSSSSRHVPHANGISAGHHLHALPGRRQLSAPSEPAGSSARRSASSPSVRAAEAQHTLAAASPQGASARPLNVVMDDVTAGHLAPSAALAQLLDLRAKNSTVVPVSPIRAATENHQQTSFGHSHHNNAVLGGAPPLRRAGHANIGTASAGRSLFSHMADSDCEEDSGDCLLYTSDAADE